MKSQCALFLLIGCLVLPANAFAQERGRGSTRSSDAKEKEKESDKDGKDAKKRLTLDEDELQLRIDQNLTDVLFELTNTERELLERSTRLKKDNLEVDADVAAPESSALMGLGLTPFTGAHGGVPRDLMLTFFNGTDSEGNAATAAAIDGAPFPLILWDSFDINRYRNRYWYRFLSRATTSLGLHTGLADRDESKRLAWGFRFTLFDYGDARLDGAVAGEAQDAIVGPLGSIRSKRKAGSIKGQRKSYRAVREARRVLEDEAGLNIERALDAARLRNTYRTNMSLGWTPSWIARRGIFKKLRTNGGLLWLSLSYGFDVPRAWFSQALKKYLQLTFHLRYRYDEDIATPENNDRFFIQDSVHVGGRLRFGSGDAVVSLEAFYISARPKARAFERDRYYRIMAGVNYRIVNNIWFDVSFGGLGRRDVGENELLFMTAFRWSGL